MSFGSPRATGGGFVALLCLGLVVAGCGDDESADGDGPTGGKGSGGAGTGGATGGAGGMTVASAGAVPVCSNPNIVGTGPTPPQRYTTEAALSADGNTAVLFGGDESEVVCPGFPIAQHLGDTWLLDVGCGVYTELAIAGPEARARHAVLSDWSRDRAIMFGGRTRAGTSGPYTLFNDVWAFDFATQTWTELPSSGTAPPGRQGMGAAIAGDELFVFGGNVATSATAFDLVNDLYAYNLTTNTWRQIIAAGAPPARYLTTMVYDEVDNALFMYGGSGSAAFFGDLWKFDIASESWTNTNADKSGIISPNRFSHHMVARKPASDESYPPALFIFGGHDDGIVGTRNDIMSFDLTSQTAWFASRQGDTLQNDQFAQCDFPADFMLPDLESPERRFGSAVAESQNGAGFLIFGGGADCGRLNDAWWFDSVTNNWTAVRQTLGGLSCPHTGSTTCTMLCP